MEATTSPPSAAPAPQTRAREDGASGEDAPLRFETEPGRYRHWKLSFEGAIARVVMDVDEDAAARPGYQLKLNSYDIAVDIELADIVQRLRFEHPEVKAVVVTSAQPRIFCAGANIYMLGSSTHAFKVNFCKFTNETRLALEEACSESGQRYLAALNGVASGGGYELALACEEILLADDGSSAVSFPETPLLAVLPGTGGLTRLVDKRKVRRDLADVFSTLAEGVRGKRAEQWGLVDRSIPKSRFEQAVAQRAAELAAATPDRAGPGVRLSPLEARRATAGDVSTCDYRHVSMKVDRAARTAEIRVLGPDGEGRETREMRETLTDAAGMRRAGADLWALRAFRELDDALLDLRFNHPTVGLVLLRTSGSPAAVRAADEALWASRDDWFVKEVLLHMRRVLKRLDLTARSVFALIEPGSCFAGSLFELALAADRSYMLDGGGDEGQAGAPASPASPASIALSSLNFGPLVMSNGLTRLASRFLGAPERVAALKEKTGLLSAEEALEEGLCTFAPDAMDWDDEVRLAIEERVSLSPDALTGMEASLRFCGPETMETKIFSRLSAWQNWIFQRPNAVGQRGALTVYGRPERPEFDWRRT
ncbi:2,3-epoxybenzoyl-CoA dihydrolase [Sorangium sp. So ce145]|uniref:2,3-epoxybenzoyl-CoA dihydrolase n=1 Tax=Sorangium sp. So ce145 TaxID=3133285 RepID=UPI003F646A16